MKNTTMIILTALILACNASAPGEYLDDGDECTTELEKEIELADDTQAELDECYLAVGDGEKVDLVADEPVEHGPFENVSNEDRQIASLLAEIERMAAKHSEEMAEADAMYNGLLGEFRRLQASCAVISSQYVDLQNLHDVHDCGVWQIVEVE